MLLIKASSEILLTNQDKLSLIKFTLTSSSSASIEKEAKIVFESPLNNINAEPPFSHEISSTPPFSGTMESG